MRRCQLPTIQLAQHFAGHDLLIRKGEMAFSGLRFHDLQVAVHAASQGARISSKQFAALSSR